VAARETFIVATRETFLLAAYRDFLMAVDTFGFLVWRLANRGILGQDGAPPSEPLGQPPGQPGPVGGS